MSANQDYTIIANTERRSSLKPSDQGKYQDLKLGFNLDTRPTGTGKGYDTNELVKSFDRSIIALPTHAHLHERKAELESKHGVHGVGIFPKREESNCREYDKVKKHQESGLNFSCSTCSFRSGCRYLKQGEKAKGSTCQLMTHDLLSIVGVGDSELCVVDEDSRNLQRPIKSLSEDSVRSAYKLVRDCPDSNVSKLAEYLDSKLRLANLGALPEEIDISEFLEVATNRTERLIKNCIGNEPNAGLGILLDILNGRIERVFASSETRKVKNAEKEVGRRLVFVYPPFDSGKCCVLLTDATADPDLIERRLGAGVNDVTPEYEVINHHRVTQIPVDITAKVNPDRIQRLVCGVIGHHRPDKLGIITFRSHIKSIEGIHKDLKSLKRRIHKVSYFGNGDDIGSNQWLECDLLLVLGTFRVNSTAIQDELIRSGYTSHELGPWGKRVVIFDGESWELSEYSDPITAQHQAIFSTNKAIQNVGRGRTNRPKGVQVLVISALDIPVVTQIDNVSPVIKFGTTGRSKHMETLRRAYSRQAERVEHQRFKGKDLWREDTNKTRLEKCRALVPVGLFLKTRPWIENEERSRNSQYAFQIPEKLLR